jgi:hypothetical protein
MEGAEVKARSRGDQGEIKARSKARDQRGEIKGKTTEEQGESKARSLKSGGVPAKPPSAPMPTKDARCIGGIDT